MGHSTRGGRPRRGAESPYHRSRARRPSPRSPLATFARPCCIRGDGYTCGIDLHRELRPLDASSRPFGEAIASALELGAAGILFAIGSSASTDGAAGCSQCLASAKTTMESSAHSSTGSVTTSNLRSSSAYGQRSFASAERVAVTRPRESTASSRARNNVEARSESSSCSATVTHTCRHPPLTPVGSTVRASVPALRMHRSLPRSPFTTYGTVRLP